MQDLSCVGQCSLTVALPILSSYGIETCVLPTAILSNHTMFKSWSYLDLTDEAENIFREWKNNCIAFDAFLLGYLGKEALFGVAEKCFDGFSTENAPVIIDPVFADNGKLYGGFDMKYVAGMRNLIRRADVILPNVTEACFLTGVGYRENHDEAYIKTLMEKLRGLTKKTIIITGVELNGGIGECISDGDKTEYVLLNKQPRKMHGTGDIFASVFTANYLAGKDLAYCCNAASQFVIDCLKITAQSHFYGVEFEKILNAR